AVILSGACNISKIPARTIPTTKALCVFIGLCSSLRSRTLSLHSSINTPRPNKFHTVGPVLKYFISKKICQSPFPRTGISSDNLCLLLTHWLLAEHFLPFFCILLLLTRRGRKRQF